MSRIFLVLVGAALGANLFGPVGPVLGAMVGGLIALGAAELSTLSSRVKSLKAELERLRQDLQQVKEYPTAAATPFPTVYPAGNPGVTREVPAAVHPMVATPGAAASVTPRWRESEAQRQPEQDRQPEHKQEQEQEREQAQEQNSESEPETLRHAARQLEPQHDGIPSHTEFPPVRWVREFLTGGNAVVRVGVVILFFGIAFLLRYMAEHTRVPIESRLGGIALGGVALLVVGWRLRSSRSAYALALQGGASTNACPCRRSRLFPSYG